MPDRWIQVHSSSVFSAASGEKRIDRRGSATPPYNGGVGRLIREDPCDPWWKRSAVRNQLDHPRSDRHRPLIPMSARKPISHSRRSQGGAMFIRDLALLCVNPGYRRTR